MAKKMLINAMHPEEARVAIVEDGVLVELDVETAGHEQTRGNVYKGVVARVEPGLQAAFVDIGTKKMGFLQMGEILPEYWQWRDDIPPEQRNRRPRIQEVLRRGQELIVQVEKGERDMKGAALTTYISIPGRYMVIMPGSDSSGISRKVESEAERKKLKELVAELDVPEGYGYIMRTEAVGRKKTELAKDLKYLVELCEKIKEKAAEVKAPAPIYQESDLVIRSIRDYFSAEIDEVLVDSQEVYKQARAFFKATMPASEKLVKLHAEKRPIFSRYQLEEQIDHIYEKKVPLKSGGSIVMDPTEALVSIDVNSGKATGERGVEDTAFKTNMEAAEEVARQLRLRDLGGLIVIDFIDMRDKKHITEVEKCLKNALKADKARVNVGRISQFGLLEMSRQRIKQTLTEGSSLICPHCSGLGKVKSVEAMALSFLRKVHAAASKGTVAEVHGGLPLEVAYYLLNRKKQELVRIEAEYELDITVKGKPSYLLNQMEVEIIRREKPLQEHKAEGAEAAETTTGEAVVVPAVRAEGEEAKKKRKRRRKKKHAGEEAATEATTAEVEAETAEEEPEETAGETAAEAETMAEGEAATGEGKKKRRRRRRRGKKPLHEGEGLPEAGAEPAEPPPEAAEEAEAVHGEDETTEAGKKRKRRRKRGPKPAGEEAAAEPVATPVTITEPAAPVEEEKQAKPARKPRAPRKKAEAAPAAVEALSEPVAEEKPVKPRRAAAKKAAPKTKTKAAEPPPAAPTHEAPAAEPAEEKPKRKRAPRKKKETTEA